MNLKPLLQTAVSSYGVPGTQLPAWCAHVHGISNQSPFTLSPSRALAHDRKLHLWIGAASALVAHGHGALHALQIAHSRAYTSDCTPTAGLAAAVTPLITAAAFADLCRLRNACGVAAVLADDPLTQMCDAPPALEVTLPTHAVRALAPAASLAHVTSYPSIPLLSNPLTCAHSAALRTALRPLLVYTAHLATVCRAVSVLQGLPRGTAASSALCRDIEPGTLACLAGLDAAERAAVCNAAVADVHAAAAGVLACEPLCAAAVLQQYLRPWLAATRASLDADWAALKPSLAPAAHLLAAVPCDVLRECERALGTVAPAWLGRAPPSEDAGLHSLRLHAAWHAALQQAEIACAADSAAAALVHDAATPYQCSLALRMPALAASVPQHMHPAVPHLQAFFAALSALENALALPPATPERRQQPTAQPATQPQPPYPALPAAGAASLLHVQRLRSQLWSVCHARIDTASRCSDCDPLSDFLDALPCVTYLVLELTRTCRAALLPLLTAAAAPAAHTLESAFEDAAALMSDALALSMQRPVALALWRASGRPLRPRKLRAWTAWQALVACFPAAHITDAGFGTVNERGTPAALDAAGLPWPVTAATPAIEAGGGGVAAMDEGAAAAADEDASPAVDPAHAENAGAVVAASAALRTRLVGGSALALVAMTRTTDDGALADDRPAAQVLADAHAAMRAIVLAAAACTAAGGVAAEQALAVLAHGGSNLSRSGSPQAAPYLAAGTLPANALLHGVGRRAQAAIAAATRLDTDAHGPVILCLAASLAASSANTQCSQQHTADAQGDAGAPADPETLSLAIVTATLRTHLTDSLALVPVTPSRSPADAVAHQVLAWCLDSLESSSNGTDAADVLPHALHMATAAWHASATAVTAPLPSWPNHPLASAVTAHLPAKLALAANARPDLALAQRYAALGAAGAQHVAGRTLLALARAAPASLPLRDLPLHRAALAVNVQVCPP